MLFRQTLLFLPAQLLPALCQFVQLIAWSHLAPASVIGVVTLFTSIQEFLNIAFMGFWNQYTQRYMLKHGETPEGQTRMRHASTLVVILSVTLQIAIALACFAVMIDPAMSLAMAAALAGLVGCRALNLFQAERARARGDVLGYSVAVMSGPVIGFLIGLVLLWRFGGSALLIFTGFAVAQLAGVLFSLMRDRSWIGFGRPDIGLIRHALGYGMPIIVSSVLAWVSQNASRFAVSYVYGLSAVGVYSLGMGLGYRASLVSAMMVNAAAFPIAVRMANAGDLPGARRQLATNGALLFAVLAASVAGLALVSGDVIHLLVSQRMDGPVQPVMLWSLLAGSFICLRQYFLNQFFLLEGNTRPIALISIAEAIVAVLLAAVAVPWGGPVGGAVALAATSAIGMIATYIWAGSAGRQVAGQAWMRIAAATGAMAAAVLLTPPAHDATHLALRIAVGGFAFCATLALAFAKDLMPRLRRFRRS
ncbi:lipopolysaccharide biosynthesis protein [Sphingobium olei]|uniref:Lipopolysaccharide biosynthesis protein n=2 Tax=Sphingobium olei TaxID=420955 RepID=A0ABW3P7D4_9SPHN|nr:lipopolysaccharide biosynthesis protein [Sphingobium sp.]